MKKIAIILLSLIMLLAACSSGNSNSNEAVSDGDNNDVDDTVSGTLVVYTTTYDIEYQLIIEQGFLEKYPNVNIETVQAGAGELKTRIQSEAANPQADIMFGGLSLEDADLDIWEEYVSDTDESLPESMRNDNGYLTWMTIQLENLLVSYEAAESVGIDPDSITGFESLLDPKLEGQIIWADPSSSSSAWNMLATMLVAMGGYESDEAWDYVEKLIANGVVIGSSSSTPYRSVYEGEYVVGLTYEAPAVSYYEGGEDDIVKIVYMEEGTSSFPFASAIIKDAPNMDLAKLFIDYVASDEAQEIYASSTTRQANTDIPTTNEFLTDINDIEVIESDHEYLSEHKEEILSKFQSIYVKYN